MAERPANTPTSDHLWAELTRLVAILGLLNWSSSLSTSLWGDPATTAEDIEDLVAGLRLDLLRLAAVIPGEPKRRLCEVLEVALGHLHVHEWAAQTRPSVEEEPLGAVVDLDRVRLRPEDPVAVRALLAADQRLAEARDLARALTDERRSG